MASYMHMSVSFSEMKHSRLVRPLCILLLVTVGLSLRVGYVLIVPHALDRDSVLYCMIAEKWHETGNARLALESRVGSTDPGYIFLLKKGIDWGFPVIPWGRSLCLAASIVFFAAVYGIGRTVCPAYGGELLLLIAILHPIAGRMSMTLLRDPISLALYAVSLWSILLICLKRSLVYIIPFSLSAAAAVFMRYEALELLPIFFIVTFWPQTDKRDLRFLLKAWCGGLLLYAFFYFSFIWIMDIPYDAVFSASFEKLGNVTTSR